LWILLYQTFGLSVINQTFICASLIQLVISPTLFMLNLARTKLWDAYVSFMFFTTMKILFFRWKRCNACKLLDPQKWWEGKAMWMRWMVRIIGCMHIT
jgi:hypothetical protein